MSKGLNWEKSNRQHRMTFVPSQRSQPATQAQIDYIVGLAHQKGQPTPRLPKTKRGASEHIERLLDLPDTNERQHVRLAPAPEEKPDTRKELVVELRRVFPQLTPMSANSLIQLFGQIDPLGTVFILDAIMQEDAPEDANELILHILKRFIEDLGDLSVDDATLDR